MAGQWGEEPVQNSGRSHSPRGARHTEPATRNWEEEEEEEELRAERASNVSSISSRCVCRCVCSSNLALVAADALRGALGSREQLTGGGVAAGILTVLTNQRAAP